MRYEGDDKVRTEDGSRLEVEEAAALKNIVQDLLEEDADTRQSLLRYYKKAERYWNGDQDIYLDDITDEWLSWDASPHRMEEEDDLPNRVINIYRQHGESLIAAVTNGLPAAKFFPADAEDPADLATSRAWSMAGDMIQKWNCYEQLDTLSALNLLNYGVSYSYTYAETSTEFGTDRVPIKENVPLERMEGEEDQEVEVHLGFEEVPRTRQVVRVWSPLNVHTPAWCKKWGDIPFLVLREDQYDSKIRALMPEVAEDVDEEAVEEDTIGERAARYFTDFEGKIHPTPDAVVEVKHVWLRPWVLDPQKRVGDIDPTDDLTQTIMKLRERFPEGVYMMFVNDELLFAQDENMDAHWTMTRSFLGETTLPEPHGRQLMEIQDILNESANMVQDTIQHGVPPVFADPEVFDPSSFAKSPVRAGAYYSLKKGMATGRAADAFYQPRGAALSDGAEFFLQYLKQMGQDVSADVPSLHGGTTGRRTTFGEYKMSNEQAMQRIAVMWKQLAYFRADTIGKAVKLWMKHIIETGENQKYPKSRGSGFVNNWIRQSELFGEIGDVQPETVTGFPLSFTQKRDFIMEAMGQGNAIFLEALQHPENSYWKSDGLGFPDLYIPGSDARDKQMEEIKRMAVNMEPRMEQPSPLAQQGGLGSQNTTPPPASSITPEHTDFHQVEVETIKSFMSSIEGRLLKERNPEGYKDIMNHYFEHVFLLDQQAMADGASGKEPKEGTQPPS